MSNNTDVFLGISGLIGGAFIGLVLCLIAYFVFQFAKETIQNPKEKAFAAFVLLAIFVSGLYFGLDLFMSLGWPVMIGAAVAGIVAFLLSKEKRIKT